MSLETPEGPLDVFGESPPIDPYVRPFLTRSQARLCLTAVAEKWQHLDDQRRGTAYPHDQQLISDQQDLEAVEVALRRVL